MATPKPYWSPNALEVVVSEELQKILDTFCLAINIRIAFCTPDGIVLKTSLNRPNCRFCQILQTSMNLKGKCLLDDEAGRKESLARHGLTCYECHAGLWEAAVPLYVNGKLAGFATIGQIRVSENISKKITSIAKELGILDDLLQAYGEIPIYTREQIINMATLFSMLMDYGIQKEFLRVEGDLLVGRLKSFIEEHISENPSLNQAAAALSISGQSLNRMLRQKKQKSYKQFSLEIKVNKAKQFIKNNPRQSVGKLAEMLGFYDAFHFSKIFKKFSGVSPSVFTHSLSNTN